MIVGKPLLVVNCTMKSQLIRTRTCVTIAAFSLSLRSLNLPSSCLVYSSMSITVLSSSSTLFSIVSICWR